MDWPTLLPTDLDYCRHLRGENQIVPRLLEHSDEHLVKFFEAGGDDETWTLEHRSLLMEILQWLTTEYACKRLRLDLGERVVATVHRHPSTLLSLLPQDLEFILIDYRTTASSLLFSVQSLYFQHIVESKFTAGQVISIACPEVPLDVFRVVEEYITTGTANYLWRRPLDMLMRILMVAGQWRVRGLVQLGADVVTRYVNRDTATEILNTAQAYVLPELKEVCCDVLNSSALGVQFAGGGEADLIVSVEDFHDRTIPMLMEVAPSITHLVLKGHVAETGEILQLLPRCSRLAVFDLTGSLGFDPTILALVPRVRELSLANCCWLTDRIAVSFLNHFAGVKTLTLSENAQLGYETFAAVALNRALENFNAVYCESFEDGFLEGIGRGCLALTDINISWCPKITDYGLRSLGSLRPTLRNVDVSQCTKVSDAGIHDLVRPCGKLERLSMQHCPLVSEEGIIKAVGLSPSLRYLDIRLCNISDAGVNLIRQRYPNLELLF